MRNVSAVAVYYCSLKFYRLFPQSLSPFLGPKLAAISHYSESYYTKTSTRRVSPPSKSTGYMRNMAQVCESLPHELQISDLAISIAMRDDRINTQGPLMPSPPRTQLCSPQATTSTKHVDNPLTPLFAKAKVTAYQDSRHDFVLI